MDFKQWLRLQEVGTTTADIAAYARPVIGSMDRRYPGAMNDQDPFFKKRKKAKSGSSKQHLS